jgi:hypothetical protein
MLLEVLDLAFMLFRGATSGKRTQIFPFAGFFVGTAAIDAKFAGF